ncbi:hypothetical protein Ae201684_002370 [Aphanomyces euteiches]|uniref:Uncharacterized protein n=1 Tax=Aphanomyces euteiches TaxID=100861 RepID=A0A6G0XQE1_9STRA|nr:hypothetical protein Ae201684_002370 [Aphanomyces euteiches]
MKSIASEEAMEIFVLINQCLPLAVMESPLLGSLREGLRSHPFNKSELQDGPLQSPSVFFRRRHGAMMRHILALFRPRATIHYAQALYPLHILLRSPNTLNSVTRLRKSRRTRSQHGGPTTIQAITRKCKSS